MVIKGSARSRAVNLAVHLARTDTNERAELAEIRGVVAQDIAGALREMEAQTIGTRARRGLYHASINIAPDEQLTPEQWAHSVNRLEQALELEGRARVVVVHQKEGREHVHVVWSRIDTDRMKAVSDSHNFRRHEEVARELEREFGHRHVQGAHVGREGQPRPERTPYPHEMQQAARTGITVEQVERDLRTAWESTATGSEFNAAIVAQGYQLTTGTKRDTFLVLDSEGGSHGLRNRLDGVKAKAIRERLSDLDEVPTVEQARQARQTAQERPEPETRPQTAPIPERPSQPPEKDPELVRQQAERMARARAEDERQERLKAEHAAAAEAEKDAWKARQRALMESRARANREFRASFKEAAASVPERLVNILTDMGRNQPDIWQQAEAQARREHQDRLNEIREADDPRRGDYRRADEARAALNDELGRGNYTSDHVRDHAAAIKDAEAARLAERQKAADEAKAIHDRVETTFPKGATPEQYDLVASGMRERRIAAEVQRDLEKRSGVRLADLKPAARDSLEEALSAEIDRRLEWEKALGVRRAQVNREGQPEILAALEERREERKAAWKAARKPFNRASHGERDSQAKDGPQRSKRPQMKAANAVFQTAFSGVSRGATWAVGRAMDFLTAITGGSAETVKEPPSVHEIEAEDWRQRSDQRQAEQAKAAADDAARRARDDRERERPGRPERGGPG